MKGALFHSGVGRTSIPTVAVRQLALADLDVTANLAAVESRVAGLPGRVDVAVFPEHTLTGFVADAALLFDGGPIDRLWDLAATEETALVVEFVETNGGDLYHTTTTSTGTPGFGALVAIVALLGAAVLIAGRQGDA